jgi:pimeloyl-ACP methyl ester carboxylesterase
LFLPWLRLPGEGFRGKENAMGDIYFDSYGKDDERPAVVLLHGLSFDRRQWEPVLRELAIIDPDRRVVAFDLPGHGESPARDAYDLEEVAAVVHQAVAGAGLEAPIVVGHSLGGVLATVYAARHPARGVINVDQPLLVGGFWDVLRRAESVLRSPSYGQVWDGMLAGMRIERLPADAQELVRAAGTPPQELLLGYWDEIMTLSVEEITRRRTHDMAVLRTKGVAYHYVSGNDLEPRYRNWLKWIMPEATVTVLPGGGHFPHLAHPAELAKILAGFEPVTPGFGPSAA